MYKVEVVMVDDDAIVRDSVSAFINLQEDLEIVDTFSSAEDFLAHEFSTMPKILLLDVGLPGMTGLEALPHIRAKYVSLEIVMLTTYEEEELILKALCSGASSYISKRAGLPAIATGLRVVSEGGSYMSPRIAREIVNHFLKQSTTPVVSLEGRQKEIMDLLLEGYSYQEVSNKLSISVETVRSHIKKIYRLLEVNNKAEAIAKYLKK